MSLVEDKGLPLVRRTIEIPPVKPPGKNKMKSNKFYKKRKFGNTHVWKCGDCGARFRKEKPIKCSECNGENFIDSSTKFGNVPIHECDQCGAHYEENKPSKCNQCDGKVFVRHASTREFYRWRELQLMQKGGFIKKLKRQVRYPVEINSKKVCSYVADFVYYTAKGKFVIEDSKGRQTPLFKLKQKMVEAYYGVPVTIT